MSSQPVNNPFVITAAEMAEIKRNSALLIGDWDRMTPAEKIADIAEFWARLWALEGNINRLDPEAK